MGSMGGGMAAGGASAGGAAAKPKVEEVVIEKEKTHYDVELTSFEAATKVKLIKELRAALGLGLKESKEMVESAPCWIKKEFLKADADDLKEKLEGLGGKVRLA